MTPTYFHKEIFYMKKIADFFLNLPWLALLILVIFLDGLVGSTVRIAYGKTTVSKVIGWVIFVSFVLGVLSVSVQLPGFIAWLIRTVYLICCVADIITVAAFKKFTIFM